MHRTTNLHRGLVNVGSESKLSPLTLSLPTCRISSSVQQLVQLAYHTLLEATASTDLWWEFFGIHYLSNRYLFI